MAFSGNVPWWIVLLGLEFPVAMGLLDCVNRPDDHFEGGGPDKRSWRGWLVVAVVTAPILLGYGILMGYYFTVVRRNMPGSPS